MLAKKYWLLANFLGWTIGVMLIIFLSGLLDYFELEGFQFYVGLGMGFSIAATHALFFDGNFKSKCIFVFKGSLGMMAPFLFADFLFPFSNGLKLFICVLIGSIFFSYFSFTTKFFLHSRLHHFKTYTLGWILASIPIFMITLTMQANAIGIGKLFIAILNLLLILSGGLIMGLTTKKALK